MQFVTDKYMNIISEPETYNAKKKKKWCWKGSTGQKHISYRIMNNECMYPNALQARQMEGELRAQVWWRGLVFSGHGSWDTLLKGHILLPRPRVIVHIKQQSYDINYVDVEEGHHHHEVRPGADAALLDVHSLPAARVPRWRRGEMIRLPLEPTKALLVLTHLLNHCSSMHCPYLTSHFRRSHFWRLYQGWQLLTDIASVITHYSMPTWRFGCRYWPCVH